MVQADKSEPLLNNQACLHQNKFDLLTSLHFPLGLLRLWDTRHQLLQDLVGTLRILIQVIFEVLNDLVYQDGVIQQDGLATKTNANLHFTVSDGWGVEGPTPMLNVTWLIDQEHLSLQALALNQVGSSNCEVEFCVEWMDTESNPNITSLEREPLNIGGVKLRIIHEIEVLLIDPDINGLKLQFEPKTSISNTLTSELCEYRGRLFLYLLAESKFLLFLIDQ
jgi:hypothetical protein